MNRKERTAMILAAGLGTRLKEMTKDKPKALVTLNGKTLLEITINTLIDNGFHHIVINVHHFADQMIDFIKVNRFDADIDISDERDLLMDTGGGLVTASRFFTDSDLVLIHNVDIISDLNLKSLCVEFEKSDDSAWLLTQPRESSRKLLFDSDSHLIGWTNKSENAFKWVDSPISQFNELSFSGMHIIRPDLFANFDMVPASVIDMYLELAKTNSIRSRIINPGYWFDLGKPEQLKSAESFLNMQSK